MDLEEIIQSATAEILQKLSIEFTGLRVELGERNVYQIQIESENPSLLIGHHGDNIQSLQHILKVILWKKSGRNDFFIALDVDSYRERQEENAINLALRRADKARQTGRPQSLPPMSSYLRRKVHLHFMNPGFEDLETFSQGEGQDRHLVIKTK